MGQTSRRGTTQLPRPVGGPCQCVLSGRSDYFAVTAILPETLVDSYLGNMIKALPYCLDYRWFSVMTCLPTLSNNALTLLLISPRCGWETLLYLPVTARRHIALHSSFFQQHDVCHTTSGGV